MWWLISSVKFLLVHGSQVVELSPLKQNISNGRKQEGINLQPNTRMNRQAELSQPGVNTRAHIPNLFPPRSDHTQTWGKHDYARSTSKGRAPAIGECIVGVVLEVSLVSEETLSTRRFEALNVRCGKDLVMWITTWQMLIDIACPENWRECSFPGSSWMPLSLKTGNSVGPPMNMLNAR